MRGTGLYARMRAVGWTEEANGLWYLRDGAGGWTYFALDGRDASRIFLAEAAAKTEERPGV